MTMNEELKVSNKHVWEYTLKYTLSDYQTLYRKRTLADEIAMAAHSSLQERLLFIVEAGLVLKTCEQEREAVKVLELAVEVAAAAIERNSYEMSVKSPTERQKLEYESNGRWKTYRDWETAIWLLSGKRDLELLGQCTHWLRARHDMEKNKSLQKLFARRLISQYVLAENYKGAIEIFNHHYKLPAKVTAPVLATEPSRVYYAIAKAELGVETFQLLVQDAVEPWFHKSQNWSSKEFIPWRERLKWVYLWHRHVLGMTNLQGILKDYRGF